MRDNKCMLQVEGLSKSFKGVRAVRDVSFRVCEREIIGLIGPNGAGKTTLFNMLAGALKPDFGRILFQEQDVTGLKPHLICNRGIARTFQVVRPFKDLTVLENVIIGALHHEHHTSRARRYAQGILELVHLAPKSSQKAGDLTLPERKRLEVARALATQPKLLLLDEVMAGLRPGEVDEMVHVLMHLNKELGLTLLVIEHVMRAVMAMSQRVIVLNYGEKIAEGEPTSVIKDPHVLECYLGEEISECSL